MKTRPCTYLFAFALVTLAQTGAGRTICTLGELGKAIGDTSSTGATFVVSGEVRSFHPDFFGAWMYRISDGTNTHFVSEPSVPGKSQPGPRAFGLLDRIRVSGRMKLVEGRPRAVFTESQCLSKGNLQSVPRLDTDSLMTAGMIGRFVRIKGRIRDAVRDDTDSTYIHMTLYDAKGMIHIMAIEPPQFPKDFQSFIGAEVEATGICEDGKSGLHRYFGPFLGVSGLENIVISSAQDTFLTAPDIAELETATPRQLAAAGFHKTEGTVLAVWGGNNFLLRVSDRQLVRVRLQEERHPQLGSRVLVLGLPTTDSFNINFVHARWEQTGFGNISSEPSVNVRSGDLLLNEHRFPQLMMSYYGKAVRLSGLVRYLPDAMHPHAPMQLESDGQIVAINASASPQVLNDLDIGSRITVSGICVMDFGNGDICSSKSTEYGVFLVPRTAEDIVILSRPSWWTPERLLALLGIFAAALLGVIGWNVSLNRRAHRKGKELAAEQLAHVTSELKVNERTRLAVELHDALSQTLTGVSMQIDTAAGAAEGKMPTVTKCLNLASRTIDACRMELRNTLWDLRSAALDEPSMDAAIRKTLCQNLAGIDLSVRFNVPRETFSDNTAHVILKIIRELATNALRHGKATSLRIAGTIEGDKLLFSVKDNGCGFDPDLAPGIAQGHFGLQGVAERLERLNGEMTINSTPGKGTKVTVTLAIPRSGE